VVKGLPPQLSACSASWVTADGWTVIAPLPAGIDGHFGPELRRFVRPFRSSAERPIDAARRSAGVIAGAHAC